MLHRYGWGHWSRHVANNTSDDIICTYACITNDIIVFGMYATNSDYVIVAGIHDLTNNDIIAVGMIAILCSTDITSHDVITFFFIQTGSKRSFNQWCCLRTLRQFFIFSTKCRYCGIHRIASSSGGSGWQQEFFGTQKGESQRYKNLPWDVPGSGNSQWLRQSYKFNLSWKSAKWSSSLD